MKITLGNWTTRPETAYVAAQVWTEDGQILADVYGETRDIRAGNAKIMAAAPRLLVALKRLVAHGDTQKHDIDARGDAENLIEELEQ